MKKVLLVLLALCAVVIALTVLSCPAEETALSPDVQALQAANRTLTDKYGHTHETLGLFNVHMSNHGENHLITYRSNGSVPELLTGEYTVLVIGSQAHALWSHDSADPVLWQSGDLSSPAWGVKQLTAYLAESPLTRSTFCDPYEKAALAAAEKAALGNATAFSELTISDRTAANAASETARQGVQAMYGLSDEVITRLDWPVDMTSVAHYPDGHTEFRIMLQDNADVLDPIIYYVTLNGDTGEILRVVHSSGGIG